MSSTFAAMHESGIGTKRARAYATDVRSWPEEFDPSATLAVHRGNGFHTRFEPYQSTRLSRYNVGP
jgi:hypothetical protein